MGGGRGRGACGAFDEGRGGPGHAVTVDVLAQPVEEGGVIAVGEIRVEGGDLPGGGVKNLSRENVAETVGGEVTEAAHAPMDVLEATA